MLRRSHLALLLLPWLLFGHDVPRPLVGGLDRVFSAGSLVDASTGPAFRADGSRELARTIGSAHSGPTAPPHHAPPLNVAAASLARRLGDSFSTASLASGSERGFRPRWLAVPHDANAPPHRDRH